MKPVRKFPFASTVSAFISFRTGSRPDGIDRVFVNRLGISGYFIDVR